MSMRVPFLPLVVDAAAGGVHGVLAHADATASRTSFIHEWASWYDVGLLIAGGAAGLLGAKPDVYEPPMFASVALLASKGGYKVMAATASTTTPPVTTSGQMRRVPTPHNAGIPAPAYGQWFHPGRKTQGATLVG